METDHEPLDFDTRLAKCCANCRYSDAVDWYADPNICECQHPARSQFVDVYCNEVCDQYE
jgi:hypothetical protein